MVSTRHRSSHRPAAGRGELALAWRSVWRRKVWIALVAVLAGAAAFALGSRLEPQYRATATLLIETGTASPLDLQPELALVSTRAFDAYMASQAELIRSRAVIGAVVDRLALEQHPLFRSPTGDANAGDALSREAIIDALRRRVRVEAEHINRLLAISVRLGDPQLAAEVANALAAQYVTWQLDTQTRGALAAAERIDGRAADLRQQLWEAEAALQRYLEAENLLDLDGVSTVAAAQLSRTASRLLDARRQLTEAENRYHQVRVAEARGWRALAQLPVVIDDELVRRYAAQRAAAQARVEQLSLRYGAQHPSLQSARSELVSAEDALRGRVEHVAQAIERAYRLAQGNEAALAEAAQAGRDQIAAIAGHEAQLYALQRDVDSQQLLYDTFVAQLNMTGASAGFDSAPPRLIDRALPPSQPSAPNTRFLFAMALAAMLFAGIAWAILRDLLADRAESPTQIERSLGLPLLGRLPEVRRGLTPVISDLVQSRADPAYSEALVALRARLASSRPGAIQQVLLVTSALPDEGKSAVASNLALALGHTGRVLLIEADLRRPVLAREFGLPADGPGLAEVLAGRVERYAAIQRLGPIDALFAGALSERPLELLASASFGRLINAVRDRYDYIVIDSPPTQAVSDSAVLARHADSALFVLRHRQSRLSLAARGLAGLAREGLAIDGLVLNRVPRAQVESTPRLRPSTPAAEPA